MPAVPAQSHDVVVIGGGPIGLACAWRAARRGLAVVDHGRAQAPPGGAPGAREADRPAADDGNVQFLR